MVFDAENGLRARIHHTGSILRLRQCRNNSQDPNLIEIIYAISINFFGNTKKVDSLNLIQASLRASSTRPIRNTFSNKFDNTRFVAAIDNTAETQINSMGIVTSYRKICIS